MDRLGEAAERAVAGAADERLVKPKAAGLAAARATSDDLAQLEEAIAQMSATADRVATNRGSAVRYQEARLAFHRGVVRAAGNATLARLSEPLHRVLAAVGRREQPPARRVAAEIEEYRTINATIAARDALQASEAMERHLDAVARDLLSN